MGLISRIIFKTMRPVSILSRLSCREFCTTLLHRSRGFEIKALQTTPRVCERVPFWTMTMLYLCAWHNKHPIIKKKGYSMLNEKHSPWEPWKKITEPTWEPWNEKPGNPTPVLQNPREDNASRGSTSTPLKRHRPLRYNF